MQNLNIDNIQSKDFFRSVVYMQKLTKIKLETCRRTSKFSEYNEFLSRGASFFEFYKIAVKIVETKGCYFGGTLKAAPLASFSYIPSDLEVLKDTIIGLIDRFCEILVCLGLFGMLTMLLSYYAAFVASI